MSLGQHDSKNRKKQMEMKRDQSRSQKLLVEQRRRMVSKINYEQDSNRKNCDQLAKSRKLKKRTTDLVKQKEQNRISSERLKRKSQRNRSRSRSSSSSSSTSSSSSNSSSSSSSSSSSNSSSTSTTSTSNSSSNSSSSSSSRSSGSGSSSSRSRSRSVSSSDSESSNTTTFNSKNVKKQLSVAQHLVPLPVTNNCDNDSDNDDDDDEFECQLINAAIEQVENSQSLCDSGDEKITTTTTTLTVSNTTAPTNSLTYSNSLLQQFAKQTQLLNEGNNSINCGHPITITALSAISSSNSLSSDSVVKSNQITATIDKRLENKCRGSSRRGFGRGRGSRQNQTLSTRHQQSQPPIANIVVVEPDEYFGGISSNVSPDSGIQDSPEHLLSPNSSPRPTIDHYTNTIVTVTTAAATTTTTYATLATACITTTSNNTTTTTNNAETVVSTARTIIETEKTKRKQRQRRVQSHDRNIESLSTTTNTAPDCHDRDRDRGRDRDRDHGRRHRHRTSNNTSHTSSDTVPCKKKGRKKKSSDDRNDANKDVTTYSHKSLASKTMQTLESSTSTFDTRIINRLYDLKPSLLNVPVNSQTVKPSKNELRSTSVATLERVKKVVHCHKRNAHLVQIVNKVRQKSEPFLSTIGTQTTPVTTDDYDHLTTEFCKKCNIITNSDVASNIRIKKTAAMNSSKGGSEKRTTTRRLPGRRRVIGSKVNNTVSNITNENQTKNGHGQLASKCQQTIETEKVKNSVTPVDLNASSSSNSAEEQRLPPKKRQHFHRPPALVSSPSTSTVSENYAITSPTIQNNCNTLIPTENDRRESVIRTVLKNQSVAESNCLDISNVVGVQKELTRKCALRKKRKDVNGETHIINNSKKGRGCLTPTRTIPSNTGPVITTTKTVTFKDEHVDVVKHETDDVDNNAGTDNNTMVEDIVVNNNNQSNPLINAIQSATPSTTATNLNVKRRKRRAINRTGFPNIRKKKKKLVASTIENLTETKHDENDVVITSASVDISVAPSLFTIVQKENDCENKVVKNVVDELQETNLKPVIGVTESDSDYDELPVEEHDTVSEKLIGEENESIENGVIGDTDADPNNESMQCLNGGGQTRSSDRVRKKIQEKMLEIRRKESEVECNLTKKSGCSTVVTNTNTAGSRTSTLKKRKKYLLAGLYSSYFKDDWQRMRRRKKALKTEPRLQTYPQPLSELIKPLHYGKHLLRQQLDFRLPSILASSLSATAVAASPSLRAFVTDVAKYDDTAPSIPAVPVATIDSWNYRKIRSNVYNCRIIPSNFCEPQPCSCNTMDISAQDLCNDEQCINRAIFAECPSRGGSHRCANQRLQQNRTLAGTLECFMTDSGKGWGVRTKTAIKASELIVEYAGEVVSEPEFKERMTSVYVHDCHHYCLHLDGGHVIDAHRMGSIARFVNHSCDPNCEMQKWSVNGHFRMVLFALRDIRPLEELTYDYNFSLFNISEGQVCKCGSQNCRGVICGKSQRLRQQQNQLQQITNSIVSVNSNSSTSNRITRIASQQQQQQQQQQQKQTRSRKNKAAKRSLKCANTMTTAISPPMIDKYQLERESRCFLKRNLCKALLICEKKRGACAATAATVATATDTKSSSVVANASSVSALMTSQCDFNDVQMSALTAIYRDMYTGLITAKDENGAFLCEEYRRLPEKSSNREYYEKVMDPIDFETIERKIENCIYRRPEQFNEDVLKLVNNAIRFYGRISESGINAVRLLKTFTTAKRANLAQFELILDSKLAKSFIGNEKSTSGEDEDVIRCVCGLYRDEGVMVQCERCLVWQHWECVTMSGKSSSDTDDANRPPDPRNDSCYLCERCAPREFNREIAIFGEYTDDGHQCYVTLMRGADLQLHQGDAVYVLRDILIPGTDRKHTYETIGNVSFDDFDIFRIERLWKNKDTGQRFAYGHHFLRPHETFHEPTRKFYENEVLRVPLYEVVPIELIIRRCWVMDGTTYCRGRPIDSEPKHIYICEYRVDKRAHLFAKIGKSKLSWPVCTKSYAFEKYSERLKITRTFLPHVVDPDQLANRRNKKRKLADRHEPPPQPQTRLTVDSSEVLSSATTLITKKVRRKRFFDYKLDALTIQSKRAKLDELVQKLINKLPQKNQQTSDLSYLMDNSRRKKRKTKHENCK